MLTDLVIKALKVANGRDSQEVHIKVKSCGEVGVEFGQMYDEEGELCDVLVPRAKKGTYFPAGKIPKGVYSKVLKYYYVLVSLGEIPEHLVFEGDPIEKLSEAGQRFVKSFNKDHSYLDILVAVDGRKEQPELKQFGQLCRKIGEGKVAAWEGERVKPDCTRESFGLGKDDAVAQESGSSKKRKRDDAVHVEEEEENEEGSPADIYAQNAAVSKAAVLSRLQANGIAVGKKPEDCDEKFLLRKQQELIDVITSEGKTMKSDAETAAYTKKVFGRANH